LVPLATALAGPAESVLGRPEALWGCAALVVVATAAVLCVPDVRNLRRRTRTVTEAPTGSDRPEVTGPRGGHARSITSERSPPLMRAAGHALRPLGRDSRRL